MPEGPGADPFEVVQRAEESSSMVMGWNGQVGKGGKEKGGGEEAVCGRLKNLSRKMVAMTEGSAMRLPKSVVRGGIQERRRPCHHLAISQMLVSGSLRRFSIQVCLASWMVRRRAALRVRRSSPCERRARPAVVEQALFHHGNPLWREGRG